MRFADTALSTRKVIPSCIGIISTTIGVSLTNALMTKTATGMSSSATCGRFDHPTDMTLASRRHYRLSR
jgi:hypothetical protein